MKNIEVVRGTWGKSIDHMAPEMAKGLNDLQVVIDLIKRDPVAEAFALAEREKRIAAYMREEGIFWGRFILFLAVMFGGLTAYIALI